MHESISEDKDRFRYKKRLRNISPMFLLQDGSVEGVGTIGINFERFNSDAEDN